MSPVLTTAPVFLAARSGGDVVRDDLGTAAFLLTVAGWVVFLVVRDRWGRGPARPRRSGDAPDRVELPDDSPAVAHALVHGGSAEPSLLGVLVLDLARRGYVEIVEEARPGLLAEPGVEWRIHRKETPRGDLRPYENALYTRLFAADNDTTSSALALWAAANRQQTRVFLERIRRYVAAELHERGYLEKTRRLPVALNLAASGLVVLIGLAALFSGAVIGLLAVASGAAQGSRTRTLRRRTLAGLDRPRQWSDVAHALLGVADLEEAPASDVEGWERCLVYAAALDVAAEFVAGLEQRDPKLFGAKEFASWYRAVADGPRLGALAQTAPSFGRALAEVAQGPARAVTTPGMAAQ